MKMIRRRSMLVGVVVLLLLTLVVLSKPGRTALAKVFLAARSGQATESNETAESRQELEQRVRTRHGWNSSLLNTVITGEIAYYNREGQLVNEGKFILTRAYPDRMRLEIQRGGAVETMGFDRTQTWKAGSKKLGEAEARDIRAWLRLWPERLFTMKGGGGKYREARPRVEDFRPATPWREGSELDPPVVLDQIEMEDTIGGAPDNQRAGDRRLVYYYIDRSSLLTRSARWLEPADPRASSNDRGAAKLDSRVDWGNWLQMGGVMWPMEVTRWLGGKVEFRIQIDEVKVNQAVADSSFENAGR